MSPVAIGDVSIQINQVLEVFYHTLEKRHQKVIATRLESTVDFGYELMNLWTEDDSGLPPGPLTTTKTLKTFI